MALTYIDGVYFCSSFLRSIAQRVFWSYDSIATALVIAFVGVSVAQHSGIDTKLYCSLFHHCHSHSSISLSFLAILLSSSLHSVQGSFFALLPCSQLHHFDTEASSNAVPSNNNTAAIPSNLVIQWHSCRTCFTPALPSTSFSAKMSR